MSVVSKNKICSRRPKEKTCNQQIKQLVVLSAVLTEVLSQLTAGRCDKIISTFLSSLRKIKEERFENQLSSPFVPKIFFHHFLFLKESFIIDYHCFEQIHRSLTLIARYKQRFFAVQPSVPFNLKIAISWGSLAWKIWFIMRKFINNNSDLRGIFYKAKKFQI